MAKRSGGGRASGKGGARGKSNGGTADASPQDVVRVFRGGKMVLVPRVEIEAAELAERKKIAGGSNDPNALYGCELADLETMTRLAKLAGSTIGDLQRRRHIPADVDTECPDTLPDGRRRCWECPVWNRLGITPF